ncbi:uncharacterized protein LOC126815931 isoform X2 [Patella vulgata]|uniref:uncharacterized protein LOC126815931 isoform X2 n=1 Tax=Patella vulgata TaxID=6465 RepID=UPI0024A87A43|nr:uncharacterized protein LOC126815931 isoform X2 [Patella vulgata]
MDPEEANKFINALVKNLQVLCHGHVNFNTSIQVIGHLYLNVDSDTNIDYIVNEKVCKNDTSSTVFVSKSYHSEPKGSAKPESDINKEQIGQKSPQKNLNQTPVISDKFKNQQRNLLQSPSHASNINPAYRDQRHMTYQSKPYDQQEPPVKIPRFAMGKLPKQSPEYYRAATKAHGNSSEQVIDLCDIKKEPGTEIMDVELDSADHSNVPGPGGSSDDYDQQQHGEVSSHATFSPQYLETSTAIPVSLHDNKHNINLALENFSQFNDPNNSSSSSTYGSGGVADSHLLQDSHFKLLKDEFNIQCNSGQTFHQVPRDIRALRPVLPESYETIISLVMGEFNTPVKLRTTLQKNAIIQFWRNKGKYSVEEVDGERRLFFNGVPVLINIDMNPPSC